MRLVIAIFALLVAGFAQDITNPYCGPGNMATAIGKDGPADLPLRCMFTQISSTPSSNYPKHVGASDSLAVALASAIPGDMILVDRSNVTLVTGKLVLPNGTADKWITVRTESNLIPDEYTRVTPAFSAELPKIIINVQNGSVSGGQFVRLIGFEISRKDGGIVYNLINGLGHDVIFDRVYVHGNPKDETTRGLYLSNSYNVAVINSYFADFHCMSQAGACTDAQAISGGTSSTADGNYKIVNNYLEASAENILFGGGTATVVTSDVTVVGNDLPKQVSWNPLDASYAPASGPDGRPHPWIVKNNFELKNGTRVLFEGNRMQYTWGGFTQVGGMILLTPKNQAAGTATAPISQCPICAVTNITVRYNYGSYAAQALQLGCGPNGFGAWPAGCGNNSIHDNVFDHLQYLTCYQCTSFLNQMGGGGVTPNQNVSVISNTFKVDGWLSPPANPGASSASGVLAVNAPPSGVHGFHFDNNVFDPGNNGIYSTGGGPANCFTAVPGPVGTNSIKAQIAKCWPDGSMTGNQFTSTVPINPGRLPWPDGNGAPVAGANQAAVDAAIAKRR